MKHFVFLTNFLPHIGGVEYFVHDLSEVLSEHWGDEIHIFTFDNIEVISERHQHYHVHRIKRLFSISDVFAVPSPISFIRIILHAFKNFGKPDCIWTHTRFFISSLLGLLCAKTLKLPAFHIEHGSAYVAHSSSLITTCARLWDQTLGRVVLKFSDKVFVVAPKGVSFVEKLGAKEPVFIPAGIESQMWRPESENFTLPVSPKLLFVGRLLPGKGIDILLEALAQPDFYHTELEIVGDGPDLARLQQMVEHLRLTTRVRFLGKIDRSRLPKIYQAASLFVNPSYSEGGPLTVLEALASGVPVVSTPVGCVSEYLEASGMHGVISRGHTVGSFVAALKTALQLFVNQKRFECAQRIESTFSWTATAKKLRDNISSHLKESQ